MRKRFVTTLALVGCLAALARAGLGAAPAESQRSWVRVVEEERAIKIETDKLEAVIPKKNPKQWMTGIEKGSFLDKSGTFYSRLPFAGQADWPGGSVAGGDHAGPISSV